RPALLTMLNSIGTIPGDPQLVALRRVGESASTHRGPDRVCVPGVSSLRSVNAWGLERWGVGHEVEEEDWLLGRGVGGTDDGADRLRRAGGLVTAGVGRAGSAQTSGSDPTTRLGGSGVGPDTTRGREGQRPGRPRVGDVPGDEWIRRDGAGRYVPRGARIARVR